MSYSFSVQAPTANDAIAAVTQKIDEVVASQPIHSQDRDAVIAAASSFINLVSEQEGHELAVTVTGSVSNWHNGASIDSFTQASVNVGVRIVPVNR